MPRKRQRQLGRGILRVLHSSTARSFWKQKNLSIQVPSSASAVLSSPFSPDLIEAPAGGLYDRLLAATARQAELANRLSHQGDILNSSCHLRDPSFDEPCRRRCVDHDRRAIHTAESEVTNRLRSVDLGNSRSIGDKDLNSETPM